MLRLLGGKVEIEGKMKIVWLYESMNVWGQYGVME